MTQEATPQETTPQEPTNPELPDLPGKVYRLDLGGPELKAQREAMRELMSETVVQLPEHLFGPLTGVEALLAVLAQQAYDQYGIDGMLTPPLQTLKESLERRRGTATTREVLQRALNKAMELETQAVIGGHVDEDRMLATLITIVGEGPAHAMLGEAINPPPPPTPPPAEAPASESPPAEPLPETDSPPESQEP